MKTATAKLRRESREIHALTLVDVLAVIVCLAILAVIMMRVGCPSDNRKSPTDFASLNNSNLSYFMGLDADKTFPAMILSGDRNLVTNGVDVVPGLVVVTTNTALGISRKMHKFVGNFGLADGSIQQSTSAGLQTYFGRTGTNVNRLAVP